MKKLIILTLAVATSAATTFGQGLVKWANSGTAPITTNGVNIGTRAAGQFNTYYIGALQISTDGGNNFSTFAYTSNSAALTGVISPGSSTTLGVAGGTQINYRILVWSYALGGVDISTVLSNIQIDDFNDTTPTTANLALAGLWFGATTVHTATAATFPATPTDLWSGISGLALNQVTVVPEPTTFALAGMGAAALLAFRRRKT